MELITRSYVFSEFPISRDRLVCAITGLTQDDAVKKFCVDASSYYGVEKAYICYLDDDLIITIGDKTFTVMELEDFFSPSHIDKIMDALIKEVQNNKEE